MTGDNNWQELGDLKELDAIGAELGNVAEDIAATVEAQQELDANGGVAFPYDPVIAQNIKIFSSIGFGVASKKYGDHWLLQPEENERLSVALAQVVNYYMPDFDNLGVVGNLALVAGSITLPRVMLTVMSQKQAEKTNEVEHDQQSEN